MNRDSGSWGSTFGLFAAWSLATALVPATGLALAGEKRVVAERPLVPSPFSRTGPLEPGKPPRATDPALLEMWSTLPLRFEPTGGQRLASAEFLARGEGYTLFLDSTTATMVLSDRGESARAELTTTLLGADTASRLEGLEELPGRTNHYTGKDPARWRADILGYRRVRAHEVYPGVDLVYYGDQKRLEYDFVLAAGADPGRIRFKIDGADTVRLDEDGGLVVTAGAREVRWRRPVLYQERDGKRFPVRGGYVIEKPHVVRFKVGRYDRGLPLTSFVAKLNADGSDLDFSASIDHTAIFSVALDPNGSVYVSGVAGDGLAVTPGAFDTIGLGTGLAAKLSPDGAALEYCTYLGSSGTDQAFDLAVDAQGEATLVGNTGYYYAVPFPTTPGAFQETHTADGTFDGFVMKLNADGTGLVYSTLLGGMGQDYPLGVALDGQGRAVVTGYTRATGFPTTLGAFETDLAPVSLSAFVTRVAADGTTLEYSSYLHGAFEDHARDVAVDAAGAAYVTGEGRSSSPISTPFQKIGPGAYMWVVKTPLGAGGGGGSDLDGDGVSDSSDNCPAVYNPNQADADGDGVGSACDNCPAAYNPAQTDTDSDGQGDACDPPSPAPVHDLAITKVKVSKKISFSNASQMGTAVVSVSVQNKGDHDESIASQSMLAQVVGLDVDSIAGCANPTAAPLPASGMRFPYRLAKKKILTTRFQIVFDCVNDPLGSTKKAQHGDFLLVATASHAAIDGSPDDQPADDVCPHAAAPGIRACGSGSGGDVIVDLVGH